MQRFLTTALLLLLFSACGGGGNDSKNESKSDNKNNSGRAPTADDILSKNIEARGGYDKVKSLRNIIFEGTSLGKARATVKVYYEHLKGMRSDFTIKDKTAYNILTTKEGWYFNPYSDKAPVPLDQKFVKDGLFQLDIQGLFVDYKSKGYGATYEGKDTAAGKQCHKIKLTKEGESDKLYFFDEEYLLVKTIASRLMNDGSYQPGWNCYFDYRKNEDGYLFSYRRTSATGQTLFDKATTNSSLPASVFEPGH